MVDNKSKDDISTTTRSTEAANLYDTVKQNYIRIVDEFTKVNHNTYNRSLIHNLTV